MACSSGRLILRLPRTDSNSLMAASAIPTMVSASLKVSLRSATESSGPLLSRSWCSLKYCMKSRIPTGRDYIGSGPRLQEDLARHLVRALLAGAVFGEPLGPSPQERRYLVDLLQRPVGSLNSGFPGGLRFSVTE